MLYLTRVVLNLIQNALNLIQHLWKQYNLHEPSTLVVNLSPALFQKMLPHSNSAFDNHWNLTSSAQVGNAEFKSKI